MKSKTWIEMRGTVVYTVLFCLFFLFALPSGQLAVEKNVLWTWQYVGKLGILSLILGIVFGVGTNFLRLAWNKLEQPFFETDSKKETTEKKNAFMGLGIRFLLILLAYLPAYLAYFPGICSYDITIQEEQMLTHQYIEHHPLAHTLLVEGFLRLGEGMGDANWGMGLYTFLQMAFLASAFAYGIHVIAGKIRRPGILLLLQLYAMFFPYHWYMALSTTKDSLFSGFVLYFVVLFYQLLGETQGKVITGKTIGFVIASAGMIVFRNNARYAYLVILLFLAVIVIVSKKRREYLPLLAGSVAGLLLGMALLTTLSKATGAVEGDKREMLSIPIQQLARVMVYHEAEIGDADKALIQDLISDEAYSEYRPDIADPVKKHTNTSVVRYRAKEFVQTYLHLLVSYPGDYINAVLAVDAGYLYPLDETHAWINVNGRDRGLGFIQTRFLENELQKIGVYKASILPAWKETLEEFADGNLYLQIPVLRFMFLPGVYLWFWIFLFGNRWIHKDGKGLLPILFVLAYLGTLLLGPTVQLRYLYPFMITYPFALLFYKEKKEVGRE